MIDISGLQRVSDLSQLDLAIPQCPLTHGVSPDLTPSVF